jgi:hypothetical protein
VRHTPQWGHCSHHVGPLPHSTTRRRTSSSKTHWLATLHNNQGQLRFLLLLLLAACCYCCWPSCRWGSARGYRLQHTYSTRQVLPLPEKFGNSQGYAWSKYKVRRQQRSARLLKASVQANGVPRTGLGGGLD